VTDCMSKSMDIQIENGLDVSTVTTVVPQRRYTAAASNIAQPKLESRGSQSPYTQPLPTRTPQTRDRSRTLCAETRRAEIQLKQITGAEQPAHPASPTGGILTFMSN
jgi:hypothetical protein